MPADDVLPPPARVRCELGEGCLVLEGPGGQHALRFGGEVKGALRGLAPGSYRWRGSRVVVREEGVAWTLSSTRAKGEPLALESAKTLTLAAPKGLRFAGQAQRKSKALQLGFSLTDEAGHGVSVYRDGHRIAVRFEVLDAEGRVIDRGAMRYG